MDMVVASVLADFFINISAGWFAAAFIVPIGSKKSRLKWKLLILNLFCAIISLVAAYMLRNFYGN